MWPAFVLDQLASFGLVTSLMMVPDTLLAVTSSIASVLLYVRSGEEYSANLTWTAVSFVLVFPLQSAIKDSYARREKALAALASMRATVLNIFLAHLVWDWPGADGWYGRFEDNKPREAGGRGMKKKPHQDHPLSPEHPERVLSLLLRFIDALQELLVVPRRGRTRQVGCCCSHRERLQVEAAEQLGRDHILRLLSRLHWAVEDAKAAGLPPNEASRINQYHQVLTRDFELLWMFKVYRTTTALRAVARISIQLLPFCYGPYWRYIAAGSDKHVTNFSLGFTCAFASMISLVLVALLNLALQMENPFRPNSVDTIRVKEEMSLCRSTLRVAAEDSKERWHELLAFEWEVVDQESEHSKGGQQETASSCDSGEDDAPSHEET